MSLSLSSLPPELLHEILLCLPISNLLSFACTSKENFTTSTLALQTLHLAVLPRRIYGVLTFLNSYHLDDNDDDPDAYDGTPSLHQVIIPSELPTHSLQGSKKAGAQISRTSNLTPVQYREQLFALQNKLACSVLSTSALCKIQTLSLHLYELTSPELATVLATSFDSLRNLHLNFSHPYIHDTCLPAHYWTSPVFLKGSPVWNSLAGLGDLHAATLKLGTLETLTLERAGITSVQLRKWIAQNPRLKQITLRNVLGVDHDFVEWLGEYYSPRTKIGRDAVRRTNETEPPARLQKLALEHCSSLILKSKADFTWLDSLFDLGPSSGTGTSRRYGNASYKSYYTTTPECLQNFSLLGSNSNAVFTNNLLSYLEEGKPRVKQVTLPDGRILVAKSGQQQQQQQIPSRKCPHSRGTAARNASTRSLNDVQVDDDATDSDDKDDERIAAQSSSSYDRNLRSVSFLSEMKTLAAWNGHWGANTSGGRSPEGRSALAPGDATIEVDERHIAVLYSALDNSRTLRPTVRRMRA
ncbi:uncharacterized protein A1O9_05617 [Exophiala aquamarina CBS 119918]|uniref:F-box domain-containing protein n=1 Tax=Exophiala aquamarina CBS 119918 TaxID=1182545 RepID=A0A072PC78_9EURO|nr:uncharacterized protein A1O9_05617 [Exophiala aquamarina CBS 119918]KEF57699.1 hypothetical protein A1O9_05617 [Exophiala aquamarina CBS 119918]